MVFQAALRWWYSDSCHQLLSSFPPPRGYLPARIAKNTTDERRTSVSLSLISPFREPIVRTGANRFRVRATPRTLFILFSITSLCWSPWVRFQQTGSRSNAALQAAARVSLKGQARRLSSQSVESVKL
jgi:hypothetical protein